ncbi:MAG TPA: phosphotransferase [Candidatus Eisenbergiella merdavium]|uniref:Phosphotransferase n=1 Tax=Candidatus Eisenbergiella merdavium TaxID=2838551 RepID=A0A9D2SPW4_9FIRM|nr:phosphotransferase [Candidatus Eisenbergiella merdavium]
MGEEEDRTAEMPGASVREDLKRCFGLGGERFAPVSGGWLNRKWRLASDSGDFLVKQYSRKRFNQRQLDWIEESMQRQIIAQREGVPCPRVRSFQGRVLRMLPDGTVYMVMEFCPGAVPDRDGITAEQMNAIGTACGAIHRIFSQLPPQGVRGFPLDERSVLDGPWEHYRSQMAECRAEKAEKNAAGMRSETPPEFLRALEREREILEKLSPDFLSRQEKGIGHEDFTLDNMLLAGDRVSAILDFDRSQYGFLLHDVGRAILSLALKDGELDPGKADAFLEGYVEQRSFGENGKMQTVGMIAAAGFSEGMGRTGRTGRTGRKRLLSDALRLTWCIEAPWWVRKGVFLGASVKPERFLEEIVWVGERWERFL